MNLNSQGVYGYPELLRQFILSDKADGAFAELVTDSKYVAIVNIKDFLVSSKEHRDRSALFFLNAISKYDNLSAASTGPGAELPV